MHSTFYLPNFVFCNHRIPHHKYCHTNSTVAIVEGDRQSSKMVKVYVLVLLLVVVSTYTVSTRSSGPSELCIASTLLSLIAQ